MKRRWVIVAITSIALIGAGIVVRTERKNRQLAKDATTCRIRAEQGDPESQFMLGSIYFHGKGVPKDSVEAVRWYRKSAEQGNAKGQYSLGYMYHEGYGVPQDFAEATRWWRKAAEQGDAKAQDGLGFAYNRGEGVAQDYAEAVRWYRKSAEQDYANAEYDLGYMYYYGHGVPQDRVEANRLFREAAAQGNERAKRATGVNRVRVPAPAMSKIMLPSELLASLYFLVVFLKAWQRRRTRAQIVTGVAALLLMSSFVMDLFWYSYIGHLQSSTAFNALYFARHFVGGVIVAVLLSIVVPRSAKVLLVSAAALFGAYILFQVVHCELKHVAPTIRLFCFTGFPVGMAIPPTIFLWLDQRTRGQGLNGKSDAAVPLATK
jgi:Sel1 repeat-containing protein